MVTVNLFPWREWRRQYQQRAIKKILWRVFLCVTSLSLVLYGVLLHQTHNARLRLVAIKRELKRQSASRATVGAAGQFAIPVGAMNALFAQRVITRQFFSHLADQYESAVCFTGISSSSNTINFVGYTRSSADLLQRLDAWQRGDLFFNIRVKKIEQKAERKLQFHCEANLREL